MIFNNLCKFLKIVHTFFGLPEARDLSPQPFWEEASLGLARSRQTKTLVNLILIIKISRHSPATRFVPGHTTQRYGMGGGRPEKRAS